jgi:hypothetical protein
MGKSEEDSSQPSGINPNCIAIPASGHPRRSSSGILSEPTNNDRPGRAAWITPVLTPIFSSLISTCRRHGIDPQRYLTQLLTNLPATPISQLGQRLPDWWKSQ